MRICSSADLVDGGPGVRFEVGWGSRRIAAFAVRHHGVAVAYLNRCAHVAMELDWMPGVFFDGEGNHLVCATHGAAYEPASGHCAGGPCAGQGGLQAIGLSERDGAIYCDRALYVEAR